MLGQLFLASCLVMMTSSWSINVSEKNVVMQFSLNVTLDCRNHEDNDNNLGKFKKITKLTILKRNTYNHWVFLAKVQRNAPHFETPLQNVMLTGNASNLSNSFIKLQFPIATDDTIGQFTCEVEGYYNGDKNVKHLVKMKTYPIVITQREATYQDMLKVILQFKEQKATKTVNDHIVFVLFQNIINLVAKDFEKVTDLHGKDLKRINDRTEDLRKDMVSIAYADPYKIWPAGEYGLFEPKYKCPYSLTFDFRNRLYTIKPGELKATVSSSSSQFLAESFRYYYRNKEQPFVNHCYKKFKAGPAWPKGSFCVFTERYRDCPNGLRYGAIEIGLYPESGVLQKTRREKTIELKFCCRNDSDASTPIALPTRDPFYLYRLGGKCQKVIGMRVTNEWVQYGSNPAFDDYFRDEIHPDSHLKPVRLELCYYKPIV